MLLEHYEYGRVVDIVHAAVVKVGVSSVFRRGAVVAGVAHSVVAHQDAANEHAAGRVVSGVGVRVLGIPGKVTPCNRGGF